MPHVLHTIWLDRHAPTNTDTLWIKPLQKKGHYGIYVYGSNGWVLTSALSESIIEDLQSDWAENIPTSPFYIRNRTHWVEVQPGSEGGEVVHKLDNKFLNLSDDVPTEGNNNPITSDAVAKALKDVTVDLSDYYNKSEINDIISRIEQFHYEVYPSLPTTGKGNVLYLIGPSGDGADRYEEYIYLNGFIKIGETSIDLSGYVTGQELQDALNNYVTNAAFTTNINKKQDKLIETDVIPETGMLPNVLYKHGVKGADETFSFVLDTAAQTEGIVDVFIWQFHTGPVAPTVQWPSGIIWANGGQAPEIFPSSHYEVSIINNLAICIEFTGA